MRRSRVPGTFRFADGFPPVCPECNNRKHVVRFKGRWVCDLHFQIANTRHNPDLILPDGVEVPWNQRPSWSLRELFVNRQHRRQMAR